LVVAALGPWRVESGWIGEIGREELGARGEAIAFCIGARASDERSLALDAHDMSPAARQRQREIAKAAEQVEHTLARPGRQQLERATDHHDVERAVHLHEIGRLESQQQLAWQTILERLVSLDQRRDRLIAA